MDIEIGIDKKQRKAIADGLSRLLADNSTLYMKTHYYHWNVTGPMFRTLHLMFEEQYNELWLANDLIAERIRALGHVAPGTYAAYGKLSTIGEDTAVPGAHQMIKNLVKGHEAVAAAARKIFTVADKANDQPTADMLTQRLQIHEKTAWMLRSLLDESNK